MSQSDSAAVGIQLLIHINAQILAHSNGLSGKCLVGLDDIEIFNLHAGLGHDFPGRRHRADTHNFRAHTCQSSCHKGSHGLHTQLFRLLLAHHYDGSRTVVDAGSVACGDESVRVDGAQLGKSFYG